MLAENMMATMANVPAIVIDCGSSQSRIGFATKTEPHTVIPTIIGRPRPGRDLSTLDKKCYIGEEVNNRRGNLAIRYPIEWGCVTNWEDMSEVLHTLIYDKLQAQPENHPFLLIEKPPQPKVNREKIIQIMFETFGVPSLCMNSSPETSLLTCGRKTGMVVEIGGGSCTPTPVFEGYALRRNIMKTLVSGSELTYHMLKLLSDKIPGIPNDPFWRETVKDIKEKLCYVAFDFEEESRTFSYQQEKEYRHPNGSVITVGTERFHCPEGLFQPLLLNQEVSSLPEITFNSIQRCDSDLRPTLLSNVLLCGGSALFPGLAPRFERELNKLAGPKNKVQVIASSNQHAAFQGATMIASAPDFLLRSLSKEFYDEYGPSVIERIFI